MQQVFIRLGAEIVEWNMVKEDTQEICCAYEIWLKNKWLCIPLPKCVVYSLRHVQSSYEIVWSFIIEPKLTFIIYCVIMIFYFIHEILHTFQCYGLSDSIIKQTINRLIISLKYNQQDATFSRSVYFHKSLYVFPSHPW
jgi:hypothetical protein